MQHHPKLLDAEAYIAHATESISRAKNRVFLLTMVMCYDEATAAFFDELIAAAERGIEVVVAADMFSYSELGGHFRLRSQFSRSIKPITILNRKLKKAGVKVHWLGNQAASIVSGRTHTKWCVIDNTVYTFGGVNLYEQGIRSTDYMFHIDDPQLAGALCAEEKRIIASNRNNHSYRSHTFGDETNRVLIDGGFVGDSIIYRHACKLAEKATAITYVSQYCPTGRLSRLLKKKSATLYFNPWNQANSLNALTIRVGSALSGLKTAYTRSEYIHCKCMLFTLPDGSQRAITGSHNFSSGGVWLGTREIALETSDSQTIMQLERFIEKHIA